MRKIDILAQVSQSSGVNARTANRVIHSLIKTIARSIENGEKVTLSGLGTFRLKSRKAKPARNLQTGEAIQLPQGNKISFKPSLSFRQRTKKVLVNNGNLN